MSRVGEGLQEEGMFNLRLSGQEELGKQTRGRKGFWTAGTARAETQGAEHGRCGGLLPQERGLRGGDC